LTFEARDGLFFPPVPCLTPPLGAVRISGWNLSHKN